MNIATPIDIQSLTSHEAMELSRLLEEKWGVGAAMAGEEGDLVRDFIVPLLEQRAVSLPSPADHLADVRRRLGGAAA